jgi:hypothetical protein
MSQRSETLDSGFTIALSPSGGKDRVSSKSRKVAYQEAMPGM